MKTIYVSQIDDYLGNAIEEDFYLKSISSSMTTKSNIPYYILSLYDKTGEIIGRIWDKNMDPSIENLVNTIVHIEGEILKNSRGETEVVISHIDSADNYLIDDFLQSIPIDLQNKYYDALLRMVQQIDNPMYKILIEKIIDRYSLLLKDAPLSPCSVGNYNGAVLVQLVSITSISVQILRSHNTLSYPKYDEMCKLNEDLVITGSILSSIGDIKIYTPFPGARKCQQAYLLGSEDFCIQILEESIYKDNLYFSEYERSVLYNIIHTVHNNTLCPRIREAAIIQSAREIYTSLSNMDMIYHKKAKSQGSFYFPESIFYKGGKNESSNTNS